MGTQDLNINFKVNDQGTAALDRAISSVKSLQNSINAVNPAAFTYLGEKVLQVTQQIYGFVEAGAKVQSIGASFDIVTKSAGLMGDSIISSLRDATASAVNNSELMQKANRLILEGFTETQMTQIAEASRVAARIMGIDVSTAFDQVSNAIVNLQVRALKHTGIVIDLNQAYTNFAARIHETAANLSDYGKQQALMEAVHLKVIDLQREMGISSDTLSEKIEAQKSSWRNLWDTIYGGMATLFGSMGRGVEGEVGLGEALLAHYGVGTDSEAVKKFLKGEEHGQGTRTDALRGPAQPLIKFNPDNPFDIEGFSVRKIAEVMRKARTGTLMADIPGGAVGVGDYQTYDTGLKSGELMIGGLKMKTTDYELALKQSQDIIAKAQQEIDIVGLTPEQIREIQTYTYNTREFSLQTGIATAAAIGDLRTEIDLTNVQAAAKAAYMVKSLEWTDEQAASYVKLIALQEQQKTVEAQLYQGIATQMTDTFATNGAKILTGQQTFAAGMKAIWSDLSTYIITQLLRIAAQQAIMGSFTSASGAWGGGISGGLLGLIGGIFHQEGGVFNQPTLGIIGEAGPEAVVPLKGGKIPVEGGGGGGGYYDRSITFRSLRMTRAPSRKSTPHKSLRSLKRARSGLGP